MGEIILFENYHPHKISNVNVWRAGVESFCEDLSDIYDFQPLNCMACNCNSVVSGEYFVLEDGHIEDSLTCLCCLTSINIELKASLLECYKCCENSYLIDALNEQVNQLYRGKCSECETDTEVRKCISCECFYHPSSELEVSAKDKYYCSKRCMEFDLTQ